MKQYILPILLAVFLFIALPSNLMTCGDGQTITYNATIANWVCSDPGGSSVPAGSILLVNSGSCPSGYTEQSTMNGKTLFGTLNAGSDVGTTGGNDNITPTGTDSTPTISWPAGVPTAADESTHTHTAGSFSAAAQVFTGNALGTHTHTFTGNAVNSSATASTPDLVTSNTAGSGVSPTTTATGTNSNTSAGTPAGTNGSSSVSGTSAAGLAHTHTLSWPAGVPTNSASTFTGNSFDNRSAFIKVIFCKKD